MDNDLQSFITHLESLGELRRIREPVSPVLEITRLADAQNKARANPGAANRADPRFFDRGGQALLFENVIGSDFPLLINAFGSYRRMELALGCEVGGFDAIASKIGSLVKPAPPQSLAEAFGKAREVLPLLCIGPKRLRSRGACQDVICRGSEIDLTRLPMLRCWPLDGDLAGVGYRPDINAGVEGLGHPQIDAERWQAEFAGRYITLAGVHTVHADEREVAKPRSHNIGMYRMQLMGRDRLAMHWHMHHDGAAHWRSWKKLGQPMPVAIALGGPSVLPYAATCPLPPGLSELLMAGFLNGRGIRLCRGVSVPLWVPADSEIIIEGFVRTDAGFPGWEPRDSGAEPLGPGAVFEGPFGDHTGFYSMPDRYPIMEVTAVTHRRNAVYPTTIVGLPPQEDYYLGKATERIMLPLLKTLIPDIEDYDLPMFGAFHNCAVVQIRKQYPLHARKVMHAVWGAGQMAWTKTVIVVDHDVDCHDLDQVLRAVCCNCEPSRDIERVHGALDILDHAAPRLGTGTKIGLDATRKIVGEDIDGHRLAAPRAIPTDVEREAEIARVLDIAGVLDATAPEAAAGWLFVRADRDRDEPDRAGLGQRILTQFFEQKSRMSFVVVLGRSVDIADHDVALFHWVANCDAGRDIQWGSDGHTVGFDATPKTSADSRLGQPVRVWPPVIRLQ